MNRWIINGYSDARESEPYKRAPQLPQQVLCLCDEQAPAEVREYWQGWQAGISDNIRDINNG